MDELRKLMSDAKKAIVRVMNCIEHNDLHFIGTGDFADMLQHIIYVQGYVDCLEKEGYKLKR